MGPEKQIELLEQFLQNAKDGTTAMNPEGQFKACTSYTDPKHLQREIDRLFLRLPVVVALSSEIKNPGDFITKQIFHIPLLLVRDKDNQARGFYNVCRHRAACLVKEPSGSARKGFACPYHRWNYNTQGELIHIPHAEGFPHVDEEKKALVPIFVHEAYGLIFAIFKGNNHETMIRNHLGPIAEELQALDLSQHQVFKQQWFETKSNWKQTLEQFLESYHFQSIHRNSVRKYFMDHVQHSESVGVHTRFSFPRANLGDLARIEKQHWRFRDYANANYLLFPNTLLLVQQDHVVLAISWPDGTGKTRVEYLFLIPNNTKASELLHYENNHKIMLIAIGEDIENGNSVQCGLESGAFENISIGRFEQGIQCFHRALEKS